MLTLIARVVFTLLSPWCPLAAAAIVDRLD